MVAVLLLNMEWKDGCMPELQRIAGNSAGVVIAGKTLAHLSVSWINFLLMAGVIFPIFGLNRTGTTINLFILFNVLALACIGIGLMISAIVKDVMLACDIALFYTSPAFVFSGFTFPRWAMPWYDQYYANIMPYTFFLDAFFKIHFMQLPLKYAFPEIIRLLLFIGFTFFIAVFFLRIQFKRKPAYAVR
ncbi:ABC transporter permease [Chitinophaga sedimenti]|uniref:ABC transporter permease n=1 Tax=Chitinophaga sedimenti TaxID=2033606 RepID=UPI00200610F9|nr:ABC transporter permease [Chitinophaga sedimenti]MCK7554456.1 ABC transporter permease [Chitinophaga sedimenti]